ncbi:hypothetical protein JCM33374_g5463 [Metschnikowia sp. JCM 33374]|nr:hypothetical protein JCM33374_g5463 [Metschnikowia sp. JCM 33374]
MSDSEADNTSVSSNGTLEASDFDFHHILQILNDSAKDAIETKDYLSYSTVLDIHLSEPTRYSPQEREALLQQLLDSLAGDHELVYEVGWDIPALIIPFVDSDFDFSGPIRSAPGVYKTLKIFEVLAHHGNAKELFLKSTELLSTLKVSDSTGNPDYISKFYDIKLYCIFELINSTLRRIHTLYPSRFLAMTVSSFVNSVYINPVTDAESFDFVMKRMYGFARNYSTPPKPEKSELSAEELKKIEDDENFLQRKLLTALLTEGVHMAMRFDMIGFTVSYFNHLHKLLGHDKKSYSDYVLDIPVMARLNDLALSFDLLPDEEFDDFLVSSEKLVDFSAADDSNEDAYSGELFEKLVVDFQNVFANCIVNSKTGSVADSLGGKLLLYTYDVSSTNASEVVEISLKQAISMAIRVIVPGIVHRGLFHRGLVDMAVFWCWYSVQTLIKSPKGLELELSSVPKIIMSTFLQALLYGVITFGQDSPFRYSALTLLTKILSAAPEDVSYNFIINSLRECPFQSAKPVLVGILRVLVISTKKADELCEKLNSLDLGSCKGDQKAPPPLPVRDSEDKSKFITLTSSRAKDILSLVDQHISLTFEESEGTSRVNFDHLSTLSSLLNLLIPLRQSPVIPQDKISEIVSLTEKNISLVEKSYKGDDEKSIALNAVTVMRVALNRLAE